MIFKRRCDKFYNFLVRVAGEFSWHLHLKADLCNAGLRDLINYN